MPLHCFGVRWQRRTTEPKSCQIMSLTSSSRQRLSPCQPDPDDPYNEKPMICVGETSTSILEFEQFKSVRQRASIDPSTMLLASLRHLLHLLVAL